MNNETGNGQLTDEFRKRGLVCIVQGLDNRLPLRSIDRFRVEYPIVIEEVDDRSPPCLERCWDLGHLRDGGYHGGFDVHRSERRCEHFCKMEKGRRQDLPCLSTHGGVYNVVHDVAASTDYFVILQHKSPKVW
jgi:hypothetical protein